MNSSWIEPQGTVYEPSLIFVKYEFLLLLNLERIPLFEISTEPYTSRHSFFETSTEIPVTVVDKVMFKLKVTLRDLVNSRQICSPWAQLQWLFDKVKLPTEGLGSTLLTLPSADIFS